MTRPWRNLSILRGLALVVLFGLSAPLQSLGFGEFVPVSAAANLHLAKFVGGQ